MSLISSHIPNFVNGVSQQPYTLRLTSQGESQENGLSTVSNGLLKRPPTQHLAKVSATPVADAYLHMIDRDGAEQYQVIITPGDLKVYDLAGNAKVVNFTDKVYLNTIKAATDSYAVTTVADYSFIVNRTKVVAVSSAVAPARPYEALFNVKLGNYGKTYDLVINNSVWASYTTPTGATAADSTALSTNSIAAALYTALLAGPSAFAAAPWTVSVVGSTVYVKNSTTDFTVRCNDGFNNNAMVAIKSKLQKFTDLPTNPGIDSFSIEIVGDQASTFDNYFVKFDSGGVNGAGGVWRESIAPGTRTGLDATTMPHKLVREADGTFTFGPITWTDRVVGDLISNPDPSFVGGTINDIFFFQNRLGFLSDENFIQTQTGKYFNVYRTTIVSLLDSDPLDVTAATNKVAFLTHAVSFNKQLLLFSAQQQFLVDSGELMTPKKVPIKPSTDFYVNTRARPVASGRNVYFTMDKGQWSSVREYFVDLNNLTNDAADVTSHVPKYVPAGITKIAVGVAEDVLVMLSEKDRTKLFIYKYYFSGNEKLQSSWSTFSFGADSTILGCDFIKSTLYLVISRADGIYFEKMDFSVGSSVAGEPYLVHLDRKVQIPTTSLTFDGVNTTIGGIGYVPGIETYMGVTKGGVGIKPGQLLNVTVTAGVAKVAGDITASPITFGRQYLWRYVVSPLVVRSRVQGAAPISDTEGRTQVRRIAFNHSATGYYRALVTPEERQTYTYIFSGQVLGSPSATLGIGSMATGRLNVPVMSRNSTVSIALESEMPLPVAIFSADWEAFYVKRSRPL